MNSILSLLVCLAMLLSGASVSETPEALSSRTLTISDVAITLGGEEYRLDPTLSIGVQTENNAALLDFSVGCGEDALFPIQAKIDETGATLLVDDASTAYTFTPEALGLSEIADEAMLVLNPLIRMIADLPNLEAANATASEAFAAKFAELTADATTEETTYSIDGANVPATRVQYTLEHEKIMALYDAVIESYTGDFFNAYFDLINQEVSASVILLDDETAMPEIDSFSDLFALLPVTLSMDFDVIATEDGLGEADLTLNLASESDGEAVIFSLPMHMLVSEPETMELSMNAALPEDEGLLLINVSTSADAYNISMDLEAADGEDTVVFLMLLDGAEHEDGSKTSSFSYLMNIVTDEIECAMNYTVSFVEDAQGASDTDVSLNFNIPELGETGLSFHTNISNAEIIDRIADKPIEVLSTDEDLENATGLGLSLMGLSSDLEKLMEDPSVAAMIEAFSAYETVESETAEIEEIYSDGTDDPSTLSFAIPEFNLPEGYILDQQYIYGEYDSASLVYSYEREDVDDHPDIFIDLYADENAFVDYVLDDSGALVMPEGRVVSIMEMDGYAYASVSLDNVQCSISVYSGTLSTEMIAEILKGL